MATSDAGADPDLSIQPSVRGRTQNGDDINSTFRTHIRGHGSFSAGTVRSPTTNDVIGGGPGVLGRVGLSHLDLNDGMNRRKIDNDEAVDESAMDKPVFHRLKTSGSVQAVAVVEDIIFAGIYGGEIVAWSLETFKQLARIQAHEQSVLGLSLSEDGSLLFSTGVDSVVNVWSTQSLERLYSLQSHFEIGDIFCVTHSARMNTLFCGAQNSSIQWYKLQSQDTPMSVSLTARPGSRKHRFFDSLGPGGAPADVPISDYINDATTPTGGRHDLFSQSNYLQYAHKGYIFAMLLATGVIENDLNQEILVTGGGGGTIKFWNLENLSSQQPVLLFKFKNSGFSVHSLAYRAPFLYAGLSKGAVHIYNLASRQLVHRLAGGHGDVLQVQISGLNAFCGTGAGWVKHIGSRFSESDRWQAHNGKILASAVAKSEDHDLLITGANDNSIAIWDLSTEKTVSARNVTGSNDQLLDALRQFVSFRTVSSSAQYVSECHQAATFLRKQFNAFGAVTSFISPQEGVNPILLAKFEASTNAHSRKTVLFYGHYDVIDADSNSDWHADPFTLYPLNGYLYGRGVTDNKGPILAALFAVADLVQHDALSCNVVFLLEGDEEAGSRGFRSAVQQHKDEIGKVDFVILSNSYWLDDHVPCLTFGMRGVVHASLAVTSNRPDLHSGVDGKSLQHEPLKDLTALLASLIGRKGTNIMIPNFYEAIAAMSDRESAVYKKITTTLGKGHPELLEGDGFIQSLMQRWREPNLTVHQVQVPESKTAVTISGSAKATLSVRIVPNQSADEVADQLETFLVSKFHELDSTNILQVTITSKADPWLGQTSSELYTILQEAVTEVWSTGDSTSGRSFPQKAVNRSSSSNSQLPSSRLTTTGAFTASDAAGEPLFIREGGSIPAISFLEQEFAAPAAMFPMGQASDNAHLSNERIRLVNLYKGREVLKRVFSRL